jgi:hypothetical protein
MTLASKIKIALVAFIASVLVVLGPAWIGYRLSRAAAADYTLNVAPKPVENDLLIDGSDLAFTGNAGRQLVELYRITPDGYLKFTSHPYRDTLLAQADTGSAAAHAVTEDAPASSSPAPTVDKAPDDLARDIYRGVTKKDWFLVAGGALALLVLGARLLLAKKWPKWESDRYGVLLVAVIAGAGGLANAWLADERLASTMTLMGAVKVWAAAVFAYVTTKKLLTPKAITS